MKKQSKEIQADFLDALLKLEEGEMLSMPLSKSLNSILKGLHELRLKDHKGQIRVLYVLKKKEAIYLLHAFQKKTQHLPKKEVNVAVKRSKEV